MFCYLLYSHFHYRAHSFLGKQLKTEEECKAISAHTSNVKLTFSADTSTRMGCTCPADSTSECKSGCSLTYKKSSPAQFKPAQSCLRSVFTKYPGRSRPQYGRSLHRGSLPFPAAPRQSHARQLRFLAVWWLPAPAPHPPACGSPGRSEWQSPG